MSDDEEQRRVKEILALTSVSSDKLVSHDCCDDFFRVPIAEAESDSDDSYYDEDKDSQVNICFFCF